MFNLNGKTTKKKALKDLVIKEVFNSGNQKKIVIRAARESVKDQERVLDRYKEMVKSGLVAQN